MGDLLNYQSDNTTIVELLDQGIHFSHHLLSHFNIQQGQLFPVIAQSENPNVHMVKWGIENPIIAEGPRLTYIYGPSIEKQESLMILLRHQRIIIPVNRFIHRRAIDEPNVIIEHPQKKVLWMAGMWYEGKDGDKAFTLITQNSIEQHRKQIRRTPIFLNHQLFINQWLDNKLTGINELKKFMLSKPESYISSEAKDMVEL